ncbi:MAG: Eco57I restriction-modification methylase domain-containing protein, partial [Planctomycetaceae bacterium]|nr:Eco57I restriction-modification methylase domain-containing protein [Planctomycetaceae bacterium]
DIQPIAVQITVLRLFLSLIQEIVPDKKKDNYGIEPLPNLETKFICANTLIGLAKENKGFFVSPSIKIAVEMLKNNRDQYVTANTTQDKQKIQEYDKKLRGSFSQLLETEAIFSYDTTERLLKWNPYDQTVSADFFDPQWMFGVEKFDIVIGNPPYIAISEKEQKIFFQEKYSEVLSGHYDLYIFFFKRGIDLLKKNGVSTFITPHTFTQYKQFLNLRKWLYENARILEITGRIEYLFKLAMVDSAITILSKSNSQVRTRFTNFVYENLKLQKISEFQLNSNEYSYDSFDIVNINNKNIIKKFYTGSKQLYEVVDSSQGITVYAKVQGKKINYFNNKCISTHSKKCTKGREICKYNIKWSTTYIEYGNWLWCPRNLKFFDAPKIFLRQTSADLIATYIEESMCCIDSVHSLIQKDTSINLKYILGILNSKFGSYLYHLLISEVGKVLAQVKLNFLRQIPIKNISPNDQQPIIALVNQILLSKKENSEADTLELETEIDRLVYKLYDLTSEEIKIIETAEKTKSK